MADIKIVKYSDIINAGGKIKSGISYTSTKCVVKNAISNFSNVSITGTGTSKSLTRLININEFTIDSATLTGISTGPFTKGSGGSSVVTVIATYSDGTTKDVTSSCTITITNSSTTGVANWNSSTLTISHGAQGTATLNASYTEAGVTKTTTAQITTTAVFPIGYTINPSSVTVEVGKTVNVDVTVHLNNDITTSGGVTYGYANNGEASYFSFNAISGGIAVSGIGVGSGNISVTSSSGLGVTAQIPVTVIPATTQLVINAVTSIPKNTSSSGSGAIYFKIYDTDGSELSSTNVTNDCTISVNNNLLTVTKNGNALAFVSGNTTGTSIITATYTYNGEVYTDTHTVSIITNSVHVTNVSMNSEYNSASASYRWIMAVNLSDGSTVYPQYTAKCTMSQVDSSYVGRTFSGPLTYTLGSVYQWAFTTTSNSGFYRGDGTIYYPSSGGAFNASTTWRPS